MLAPRRRMTFKKRFITGMIAVVVLLIGLGLHFGPPPLLTAGVTALAQPFWQARTKLLDEATVLQAFHAKTELVKENEALRATLRDAQFKLADRALLVQENRELKQLVGNEAGAIAAVFARPNTTPYDTLIIDVGEQDVAVGDDILVGESILIGQVREVFGSTAHVQLFSSPGVETEVTLPESEVVTIATGLGGGNFTLRIPSDILVSEHDPVTFGGLESRILGFVHATEITPGDLFQTVLFRTPANLSTLRWVVVDAR